MMDGPTRVFVANGSPKGEYSLTLQHTLYMLGQEDAVEWRIAHIGEALSPLAYDRDWLARVVEDIAWCDAIIWTTPVYTMLVPWQLMRFFDLVRDLIGDMGKGQVFAGKYATSMLTCFHYYDHLAEEWLRSTSEDLGMSFIEGRTADSEDMLKAEHRASMRFFMHEFLDACRRKAPVERKSAPLSGLPSPRFTPSMPQMATGAVTPAPGNPVPRTVLLTDEYRQDGNLSAMIDVFIAAYPHPVEVVNINDFPYEAGCHGCLRCELVGECDRKDGFQQFYADLVNTCDVLVFGMNTEGRYLKPVWKLFLDRSFANGHRTSMMGQHTCYLVAGRLRELPNVRQFLEGKDQVGRENSMGILSDEYEDCRQLEMLLQELAGRLARAVAANYQKSANFLGLGGIKIFRDLIYSMRGVVRDDHRFYKERGLYDFPQRNLSKQAFNVFMGAAFMFEPVRLQAFERMPAMYIQQHKRIVDSGEP